ncbi:hypothetical protein B0H13DRAFT_1856490 [Mycena leptocephala]|nr:hypothetical protein B0H13DRAFT_1856490 [Mycena leptocephala]
MPQLAQQAAEVITINSAIDANPRGTEDHQEKDSQSWRAPRKSGVKGSRDVPAFFQRGSHSTITECNHDNSECCLGIPLLPPKSRRVMSRVTNTGHASLCKLPHRSMARKQGAVPLRHHYSHDLKRRIIHMSQKLHLNSTEIAIFLDLPLRVVQRVRRVWNEIGEVCWQWAGSGRAPLTFREAIDVCITLSQGFWHLALYNRVGGCRRSLELSQYFVTKMCLSALGNPPGHMLKIRLVFGSIRAELSEIWAIL